MKTVHRAVAFGNLFGWNVSIDVACSGSSVEERKNDGVAREARDRGRSGREVASLQRAAKARLSFRGTHGAGEKHATLKRESGKQEEIRFFRNR
jgi:hypothetical protein